MSSDQARPNAATGQGGEDAAAHYLARQGCSVLARNWRARHGEIDLVVECPADNSDVPNMASSKATPDTVLAFVEVRTRHGRVGLAEESISRRKAARMAEAAYAYMEAHNLDPDAIAWRIDVVAISMSGAGVRSVNWIKGALDEGFVYGG